MNNEQATQALRAAIQRENSPFVHALDVGSSFYAAVGLTSPMARFAATGAAVAAILWTFKPSLCFQSDGTPKEWAVLNSYKKPDIDQQKRDIFWGDTTSLEEQKQTLMATQTYLPWYLLSGLIGVIPAMFF